eukprot:CAMPEP_0117419320 /NCGR_PEP_ID=MMETSP0758-20121206/912_1 /TAXON_ID=63605 /ORGANISM="Percolomonas cosmopolitus, Strain AE-1 (ATCC 50343)" /LENGTH=145 /DNA_ID=CAMNT_0005200327 /DNA_START=581 /DNA_END=1018 /DNA_ORIENTATION=-
MAHELLLPLMLVMMMRNTNVYIDNIITLLLAFVMAYITLQPLSKASFILLQTSPKHFLPKMNKLLREASIIEGVLECHSEHFWTIGFDDTIVGTMKVRVTNDADEQIVLKSIHDLFEKHVHHLTIQIEKVFVDKNTPFVPIVVNE